MILVDSVYLIALAKPRDDLHARAAAWSRCVREPLITPEYVLVETVNYLSLPGDRAKAHALLERVMAGAPFEFIPASPALFAAGLELHRARADKERSLTDCISFRLMWQRGARRALAYDIHFEQAGFEALMRSDPTQSNP